MKTPMITLLLLLCLGCNDGAASKANPQDNPDYQLLQKQGYTDIQLKGWAAWKCADDDNMMYTDTPRSQ